MIKSYPIALFVISVGAVTIWSAPPVTAAVSSTNIPALQTLPTMPEPQEPFDNTPIGPTETVGASSLD